MAFLAFHSMAFFLFDRWQHFMIPLVDLGTLDTTNAVEAIRSACEDVGFFYLIPGESLFPQSLMDDVFARSKAFFDLDTHSKRPLFNPVLNRGYTGLGEETLDPEKQSCPDTKEGYYIGREVPLDKSNADMFCGPNIWPDEAALGLSGWRATMAAYHEQATTLCMHLLSIFALGLGLPAQYFHPSFREPLAVLRLLRYSMEPSDVERGVLGCGAHSDYGFITLLLTNEVPGLQILYNDEWVPVPPKKNAFVVNIGDMLERWTNGRYRSTVHRVVMQPTTTTTTTAVDDAGTGSELRQQEVERLSCPFFFEPSYSTRVECLPGMGVAKFEPVISGDYLKAKYMGTHADYTGGKGKGTGRGTE